MSLLTTVFTETKQIWNEFRRRPLREFLGWMNTRDAPALVQFVKYGICGGGATVVHNVIFILLGMTLLPLAKGSVDEAVRAKNIVLANVAAFPFGGLFAYITNRLWVFVPGKHSRAKEAAMFFAAGAAGFFPGLWLVGWMASTLHVPSTVAQLGFLVTSVLVNFVLRKFVIFKK